MTGVDDLPAGGVRRRHLGKNYFWNMLGTLVPIVLGLVIVPLYIAKIGVDRYGIMCLVWILLGYFGFMDLGLSRASANALSRLSSSGYRERVPVLMTALYLNVALGAFAWVVVYGAGRLLMAYTSVFAGPYSSELSDALPWMAFMLPLSMIGGVGTGAIESREHFLVSNAFSGLSSILAQILPISCAVLFGPSLALIVPAALIARLASTLAVWIYVVRTEGPIDPRCFDRTQVRKLLGYGVWASTSGIISPLLETVDQVLIGAILGPASVAHYNVPMNLATRTQFVALALARTLFPRLSSLRSEEAAQLGLQATVTLAYGIAAICAPAMILAGPFLNLWIGPSFAEASTQAAIVLLFGAWTNGIAFVPFTFLQSRGRPDLAAKIHASEILPFLAAVWALTTWLGIWGAALAWTLRVTIDLLLMLTIGGLLRPQLLAIMPASIIVTMSAAVATIHQPTGVYALVIACIFGAIVLCCAFVWDTLTRSSIETVARSVFRSSKR